MDVVKAILKSTPSDNIYNYIGIVRNDILGSSVEVFKETLEPNQGLITAYGLRSQIGKVKALPYGSEAQYFG